MNKIWIATGILFFPSLAAAHLEHAVGDDVSLTHFLLDPVHVALTSAAVLLVLTVRHFARRERAADRDKE